MPQARLAAVRYIAGTAIAPSFSAAPRDRWSERNFFIGLFCHG